MKVWIYSYSKERCTETELQERTNRMLLFAGNRRMEVIGVTSLNKESESQMRSVLKKINKMHGDGIVIYDMEDLPIYDRTLLMDSIYLRKITIFCCKYSGKEVV